MSGDLERSLVAQLDPERDYGSRTYEQVVSEVQSGALLIQAPVKPGYRPILRDAATRAMVKGTGPATLDGGPTRSAALHARLIDWAEEEGLGLAVSRLQDVIAHGNQRDAVKAIEVLFKHVLPRPREASPDNGAMDELRELLLRSYPAEVRVWTEPGRRPRSAGLLQ